MRNELRGYKHKFSASHPTFRRIVGRLAPLAALAIWGAGIAWLGICAQRDSQAADRQHETKAWIVSITHWEGQAPGTKFNPLPRRFSTDFFRYRYMVDGKTYEGNSGGTFEGFVYYDSAHPERSTTNGFDEHSRFEQNSQIAMLPGFAFFVALALFAYRKRPLRRTA